MKILHATEIKCEVAKWEDPKRARFLQGFFRTGKGEYGEGDRFLGLSVPLQRSIAAQCSNVSLKELEKLLASAFHEHRLIALFILVRKFQKADSTIREQIVDLYLRNRSRVNNWDLVDSSAPQILGVHLLDKDRKILTQLAKSDNLWDRRIAIVATQAFIRKGDLDDTFRLAKLLMKDRHDLIHKATGWMLRETGKKDEAALLVFLEANAAKMPRTALRYAIERLPAEVRGELMRKGKE